MSEEFPYADIIIIALVVVFILLRLRSILGQKTGHENPNFFQISIPKTKDNVDAIIQPSDKAKQRTPHDNDPYAATLSAGAILQTINDIKSKDTMFSATTFMDGAKMAFEMIFDAFVKGDKQTLSMLLSQEIYNDFVKNIEERERQENRMETTLLSVAPKDIVNAGLNGNIAQLTVHFESEQVTLERNKKGDIISGDPSNIQHVRDEWIFERDITSKNPNWKIIET